MEFVNRMQNIPYISPIILDKLAENDNQLSVSAVEYNEKYVVKKGAMILGLKKGKHIDYRYAIATGNIVEKDGKKYYEAYPELYTMRECRLLDNALKHFV
jgi:hypothetical protein